MHFRLVRPMRRKGSINHQFVQRIPADVKARAVGMKLRIPVGEQIVPITVSAKADAIRLSLRSSEPSVVKARQAQAVGYLETVWTALRKDRPVSLTYRQSVALAKDIYRDWANEDLDRQHGVDFDRIAVGGTLLPSSTKAGPVEQGLEVGPNPDALDGVIARLSRDDIDTEKMVGSEVSAGLLKRGIGVVDEETRAVLCRAFLEALRDGMALRRQHAAGDYSPDPKASRFPDWTDPPATSKPAPKVSLKGLVDAWWVEAKASGRTISTYESYKATFSRLAAFLKHDDAQAVKPDDIVSFKDHRLAEGISPKTVGDGDIAGLRSVFDWAVTNLRLPANPAEKVKVKRPKVIKVRDKGLERSEAAAVLSHSLNHKRGAEQAKTFAAKRWVPWLCAYTGARVGEVVQLRKQDLRQEGDMWVLRITPEAGTVKDKEAREVVLHEHLIEQGFPVFVAGSADGYLFVTPSKKSGEVRGVWRATKNRVREFVREVLVDPNVQPNHGWRHAFKTVGREAGIQDSVLDAICGHAAKTVGGAYGGVSLKAQAEAMGKFPRYIR